MKEDGGGVCMEVFEEEVYVGVIEGDMSEDEVVDVEGKVLGWWCKGGGWEGDV